MDVPKYAQLEHERRFLVMECPDISNKRYRLIEDLYVSNCRLRLRKITHSNDPKTEFKLCKKYESNDTISAPIVNVYLKFREWSVLSKLPGQWIRTRRYNISCSVTDFALDIFEDKLSGLMLCEAEGASASIIQSVAFPKWATLEITDDPFFTGGNLVKTGSVELNAKMLELGRSARLGGDLS